MKSAAKIEIVGQTYFATRQVSAKPKVNKAAFANSAKAVVRTSFVRRTIPASSWCKMKASALPTSMNVPRPVIFVGYQLQDKTQNVCPMESKMRLALWTQTAPEDFIVM